MGGGKGGGGGGSTTVQMPAEQKAIYQQLLPMIQSASEKALGGQPLYPVSPYPNINYPSAGNYFSQLANQSFGWNVPQRQVESATSMMPGQNWWSGLDAGVKQGIMQPFETGADTLAEQLNKYGQLGNARGGTSGIGATGLSNYWAEAMPKASLTGWSMTQPALQQAWQARNQQGLLGWQAQLDANKTAALAQRDLTEKSAWTDYQNLMNQAQAGPLATWQAQNQAYAAPWTVAGATGQVAGNLPQVGSYNPSGLSQAMGVMGGLGQLGMGGLGLYGLGSGLGLWGGGAAAASAIPWLAGSGGLAAGAADIGSWLIPALGALL